MICPYCGANDDRVIDSRASEGGRVVRRRRVCNVCGKRFTTYERVEESGRLLVIKRDGTRVAFDRDKLLRGVSLACGKRQVSSAQRERLVEEVEETLFRNFEKEVPALDIGRLVMAKLRDLDEVAYIRFASEYYQFETAGDLREEIEQLTARTRDVKDQQQLFDLPG